MPDPGAVTGGRVFGDERVFPLRISSVMGWNSHSHQSFR